MTIKDFKVGDKILYLNFHDRGDISKATLSEGYISSIGKKYISVSKDMTGFYCNRFVIDASEMCLSLPYGNGYHINDLVFRNKEDYHKYIEWLELRQWVYKFNFNTLPYDILKKIKEIAVGTDHESI